MDMRVVQVLVVLVTLAAGRVWAQAGIQYVYDELGRLIGVVDPAGDAAVYHYDPVGNLLSIERYPSSQVSVISFTPAAGPVGASVTIYGTGFSSTPVQNTVTFNGTGATVMSATPTTLVVTVPAGATTGAVGVTTPAGSDTSGSPFIVAASNAPAIAGFSPAIGVVGATVSVTGTNFSAVAAQNRAKVNETAAQISTSTTTSFTTAIPTQTGSGPITLITPIGSAVSSTDFFVAPSPFTAADVQFTARMLAGGTQLVTIGTATRIGLVTFAGTAGQRIALRGTNAISGQAPVCDVDVSIRRPNGTSLVPATCMEGSGFIDTVTLPASGTYTILVDPGGNATGNITLTLYDVPPDATAAITPGGAAVTVTTTTPGQNAALTFAGTSGQRVAVKGTNGMVGRTPFFCELEVSLRKPDGSTLAGPTCMEGSAGGFLDVATLTAAGTYTIVVNPLFTTTGSLTVTLYDTAADVTETIAPGGASVTVTTTTVGQNAVLSFDGIAGQRVSLRGTNGMVGPTAFGCDLEVTIRNPGGTALTLPTCMEGSGGGFIDATSLPSTGTYTIRVDPLLTTTGSLTLSLYDVPADVAASTTAGGSPLTVTIAAPGQNGLVTFTGSSGQRVSLVGTNGMIGPEAFTCDLDVGIRKPDGTALTVTACMEGSAGGFIDATLLPVAGTYTIFVNPRVWTTGSVTLALHDVPANASATATVGGPAVQIANAVPGQNADLTFAGAAAQQVTIRLTSSSMGTVTVRLLRPDLTQITSLTSTVVAFDLPTQTLPSNGTYTVRVDPAGATVGSITVTITTP